MNETKLEEYRQKRLRINYFLDEHGYDAVLIGTTANFAWATCGGDNHIILDSQNGSCILLFTKENATCIANKMDSKRLEEQELSGLDIESISLKWFETSPVEYALNIVKGKRVLSDLPLAETNYHYQEFYKLHYPLTTQEIERYRKLGKDTEEATVKVAEYARKGMTANDIQTALLSEFSKRNLLIPCMIIGVDEEISRYRHPLPKDKKINEALMLVLVGKRYGLNIPITRMIYFRDIPKEIEKRYQAACTIEANTILNTKPGKKFYDISAMQRELYEQLGYKKEWEEHFAGGITGYIANDASFCTDQNAKIIENQTFNWYITITGVNAEETMVCKEDGHEIFTTNGLWPDKTYKINDNEIALPQILIKD